MAFDFIGIIIFLFAIAAHEASHAFVADRLGDATARLSGRLTLNPLAHLDPLGALAFLFVGIGWAKPVPVNPLNFSNPVADEIKTALAGPASNIILAVIFAFLYHTLDAPLGVSVARLFLLAVQLNLLLAVFNLLPLPPLDGSKLLRPFLNFETYLRLQQYGGIILIILLVGLGSVYPSFFNIIRVPVDFLYGLLTGQTL